MFEDILFSFNQVDLQNMMDPKRSKRYHHSKFIKQVCYYTIVLVLQIRSVNPHLASLLILSTSAWLWWPWSKSEMVSNWPTLMEWNTPSQPAFSSKPWQLGGLLSVSLSSSTFSTTFCILLRSLQTENHFWYISSLLQVDISNIQEKLVVALLGYEINLLTFTTRG